MARLKSIYLLNMVVFDSYVSHYQRVQVVTGTSWVKHTGLCSQMISIFYVYLCVCIYTYVCIYIYIYTYTLDVYMYVCTVHAWANMSKVLKLLSYVDEPTYLLPSSGIYEPTQVFPVNWFAMIRAPCSGSCIYINTGYRLSHCFVALNISFFFLVIGLRTVLCFWGRKRFKSNRSANLLCSQN